MNFILDLFQNAQAFSNARAAKTANRGAVGFVVAGFEDEGKPERPGHAFDDLGHADGVLFAFDHARAGNEEEIARADADVADLEEVVKQKPFMSRPQSRRDPAMGPSRLWLTLRTRLMESQRLNRLSSGATFSGR